jgi:hypothetical protein
MAREIYKGRQFTVYFLTPEDLEEWSEEAQANGASLNKYILEMAQRGREDRREHSTILTEELGKLKVENNRLQDENKLLSMLREKYENELFKLRHSVFLLDDFQGKRSFAKELQGILKQGGHWTGHELLEALKIDPRDSEAVRIAHSQLKLLQDYGIVREEAKGWCWIS